MPLILYILMKNTKEAILKIMKSPRYKFGIHYGELYALIKNDLLRKALDELLVENKITRLKEKAGKYFLPHRC